MAASTLTVTSYAASCMNYTGIVEPGDVRCPIEMARCIWVRGQKSRAAEEEQQMASVTCDIGRWSQGSDTPSKRLGGDGRPGQAGVRLTDRPRVVSTGPSMKFDYSAESRLCSIEPQVILF